MVVPLSYSARALGIFLFVMMVALCPGRNQVRVVSASVVLAIQCMDGIIVGSDTLSTNSGRSAYVGNRLVRKVFPVNENVIACCAGNDQQGFLELRNELQRRCRYHQIQHQRALGITEISTVARRLVSSQFPSVHMVLAGVNDAFHDSDDHQLAVDEDGSVTKMQSAPISKIYEILPGGSRFENLLCVAGPKAASVQSLFEELAKDLSASSQSSADSESSADISKLFKTMPVITGLKLAKRVLRSSVAVNSIGNYAPIELFVYRDRVLRNIDIDSVG
jgi:20S proteasome alpha/beta subunit